jgi:TPP-dependent pyruvate/acetoin dehydrogenase alpha subunit
LSAPLQKPDVEAEFLKEARKTPAERLHEALLKKLGLTEEEFAALDPQSKAAVEEAVKSEIVKQAQAKSEKSLGLFTDVSV